MLALALVAAVAAPAGAAAQDAALRTAWGDPDLQGVWDFRTITPMERPAELAGRQVLTAEEAASYEHRENLRQNRDLVDPEQGGAIYPPASEGGVVPYNEFWYDRGSTLAEGGRTSLIVDPPDGRIPPLAPGARQQGRTVSTDVEGERPVRFRSGGIGADGPEDRALGERCLLGFNAGPPVIPSAYNNAAGAADTPPRGDLPRDDPRRPHHPAGWPRAPAAVDPPVAGRLPRPLGGRHARCRDHQLHCRDRKLQSDHPERARHGRHPASGGALHARGCGPAALRVHRGRSAHVHTDVHRRHPDAPGGRTALRICLPRGNYGMFNLLAGARAEEQR